MAITNPRTGEQVRFADERDDVLVMESTWPPGGRRTPPHAHPGMEERWTVLEGEGAFRVGGEDLRACAGESVVAPPGVRHEAWNPTDAEVRVRIEMRPPLRWREFTERLFAGDDARGLLAEYREEIAL